MRYATKMGLDIVGYSNLKFIGHHRDAEGEHCHGFWDDENPPVYQSQWGSWGVRHVDAYAYADFPHALLGLPDVRREDGFIRAGCFEVTPETKDFHFRAGSYGGYSAWRHQLGDFYNPFPRDFSRPPASEGPFYELLWFADNEGTLTTEACKTLLHDFQRYEDDYVDRQKGAEMMGEYNIARYRDWMMAFHLGAHNGLVDFH